MTMNFETLDDAMAAEMAETDIELVASDITWTSPISEPCPEDGGMNRQPLHEALTQLHDQGRQISRFQENNIRLREELQTVRQAQRGGV